VLQLQVSGAPRYAARLPLVYGPCAGPGEYHSRSSFLPHTQHASRIVLRALTGLLRCLETRKEGVVAKYGRRILRWCCAFRPAGTSVFPSSSRCRFQKSVVWEVHSKVEVLTGRREKRLSFSFHLLAFALVLPWSALLSVMDSAFIPPCCVCDFAGGVVLAGWRCCCCCRCELMMFVSSTTTTQGCYCWQYRVIVGNEMRRKVAIC
jgi:hypothetical protein